MSSTITTLFLQSQPSVYEKIEALRGGGVQRDAFDVMIEIMGFVALLVLIAAFYLIHTRRSAQRDAKVRGSAPAASAPGGVQLGLEGVEGAATVYLFWNEDGLRRRSAAVLRQIGEDEIELGELDSRPPPAGPARLIMRDESGKQRLQDVAIRSASSSGKVLAQRLARPVSSIPPTSLRIDAGLPARFSEGDQAVRHRARILDLTQGGAGLVLERKLDVGRLLRLEIDPVERIDPLGATAKVAWCQDAGDGLWRAGVAFEGPEPQFAASLFDLLCEMCAASELRAVDAGAKIAEPTRA